MIIYPPADAVRFATRKDDQTDYGTNFVLRLRREVEAGQMGFAVPKVSE